MLQLYPDVIYRLFLLLTVIITLIYFKNYIRAVILALSLPGPGAYPIIGNALLITNTKKLMYISLNSHKLYGPIYRAWISLIPFFVISDATHLQTLLSNGKLTKKNMFYSLLHNFLGEGLITNNGEKWRIHRKLIQPYFRTNILANFVTVFDETSKTLIEEIDEGEVNITRFINNWVLDTLHKSILGISIKDETYKNSPFRKGELVAQYRISRPWMLLDFIFGFTKSAGKEKCQKSRLQEFTKKVVDNKRKELNPTPTNFTSFLEMFFNISESDANFTEEDIINETCTFMLAGQDSVGAAVAFSLHFLAKHQDIQEKVYKEQKHIFDKDMEPLNINHINQMKYLEQCIKEAMRLCPSVPIINRQTNEDITLGKYTIPAGANIIISPFEVHRLEDLYPNPLKYDPDRFSAENAEKIHPYGYLPFSAGTRNCIGYKFALLEMKAVISSIIRKFHLGTVAGKEELNLSYRITLRASGGVWIKLTRRS